MKNKYLLRSSKKRQNKVSVILITIVLVMLVIVVSVGKHNISKRQAEYDKREARLLKTKKYAEEVAKEKLGLVKEDEIIFKEE